ncbi:MAG: hypothetical protein Q8936_14160 [Bacillota bacterium]|nr:hypothetical protein [Bacillota bacterium]
MSKTILSSRFQIVKGMTNMNHHIDVRCFIDDLISNYSKPDRTGYILPVDSLPDTELNSFSAMIIMLDDDRAMESTGPDNPYYTTKMLPALTKHLTNPTDKELQYDFMETWRDCVSKYFMKLLEELIEERLYAYNYAHGYVGGGYYESQSNFV